MFNAKLHYTQQTHLFGGIPALPALSSVMDLISRRLGRMMLVVRQARQERRNLAAIRHLDEHLLQDIGYIRPLTSGTIVRS